MITVLLLWVGSGFVIILLLLHAFLNGVVLSPLAGVSVSMAVLDSGLLDGSVKGSCLFGTSVSHPSYDTLSLWSSVKSL